MAAKQRNNLKAGIFILVSIGLIVTVILSITGLQRFVMPEQERAVSFKLSDDLGGLRVGDEVRVGGFKVGTVKRIEVRNDVKEVAPASQPATAPTTTPATAPARQDATRLLVTFTLPRKYELNEDAMVGVQTGLTGTANLNVASLGTGNPADPAMALVGQPSALNSLFAGLGGIAPELSPAIREAKDAIGEARVTVADVRARVVPTLADTLDRYKGAGEHLRDVLGDSKTDLRGTIANLKESTTTLKDKLPGTMDAAHKFISHLDDTVQNTQGTLEDVKTSMANFRVLSEKARDLVGGNKGKLDTMIASLKVTGDNLKAASAEIRHSPWRLLYKPGKGEMANLNLYDSARQFADGAGSLNDAALALRDALASKETKPEEVKALLQKLDTSFANFKQMEDKLWTTVQE